MTERGKELPPGVVRGRKGQMNKEGSTAEQNPLSSETAQGGESVAFPRDKPEEPLGRTEPHLPAPVVDQALLSNFTHQIVNPLNGILGTLHNIIDGSVPEAKRDQRLRALYAQLQVTVELVRNLAYLSQLSTQAGRDSIRQLAADVNVPRTIIESAQFFQELGNAKGMRIGLVDRDAQFVVKGHTALLRQVFLNLFENAIKYGKEKTEIAVTTRVQSRTGTLLIEVINEGEGIEPDETESIFDLGFRGRHARKVLASGSGLGLYICRQILMIHDASISAEYSRQQGTTTFRLAFPQFRLDTRRDADDEY